MKRYLIFLILCTASLVLASPLDGVLERYQKAYFEGRRFLVDLNSGGTVRYELVVKEGDDKLVNVILPEKVTWLRFEGKYYLQRDSELLELTFPIYDLEDYLIALLKRGDYRLISQRHEGSNDVYVVKSGIQTFTIWIGEDGFIYKIVRELPYGYRTTMIYEYHRLKESGGTIRRYWLRHPVMGKITSNLSPILKRIPDRFAWSDLRFVKVDKRDIPVIYGITNEGYRVTIVDLDGVSDSVINQMVRGFSRKNLSYYVWKARNGLKFLLFGNTKGDYLKDLAATLFRD